MITNRSFTLLVLALTACGGAASYDLNIGMGGDSGPGDRAVSDGGLSGDGSPTQDGGMALDSGSGSDSGTGSDTAACIQYSCTELKATCGTVTQCHVDMNCGSCTAPFACGAPDLGTVDSGANVCGLNCAENALQGFCPNAAPKNWSCVYSQALVDYTKTADFGQKYNNCIVAQAHGPTVYNFCCQ